MVYCHLPITISLFYLLLMRACPLSSSSSIAILLEIIFVHLSNSIISHGNVVRLRRTFHFDYIERYKIEYRFLSIKCVKHDFRYRHRISTFSNSFVVDYMFPLPISLFLKYTSPKSSGILKKNCTHSSLQWIFHSFQVLVGSASIVLVLINRIFLKKYVTDLWHVKSCVHLALWFTTIYLV